MNISKTTMTLAMTAALGVTGTLVATENPFSMQTLDSGYVQLAEAKCGADKKSEDAKCGGDKSTEAKCGADKKAEAKSEDGKCGADKKAPETKAKDGKCGESKCGANKK